MTAPVAASQICDGALRAHASSSRPAQETVGDIRNVAASSNASTQVTIGSNRTRVVATSSLVVVGNVTGTAILLNALLKTSARRSTGGTIQNHLVNLGLGAGSGRSSVIASTSSIVALHETRVVHTIVGSLDTNATVALLHHNSQDEARVQTAGFSDGGDGTLDVIDLLVGVVVHIKLSTALLDGCAVALEHIVEARDPFLQGGPAVRHQTVTTENRRVQVGAASIERMSGSIL